MNSLTYTDLILIVAGAFILRVLKGFFDLKHNKKNKEELSISGNYFTTYEIKDENNMMIKKKATASIELKNNTITGESTSLSNNPET